LLLTLVIPSVARNLLFLDEATSRFLPFDKLGIGKAILLVARSQQLAASSQHPLI
jgi:hypothetical protein